MVIYLKNINLVTKRCITIKLYKAYNTVFDISICSCRVNLALGRAQLYEYIVSLMTQLHVYITTTVLKHFHKF